MSVPSNPRQWFDVASERASDADAMLDRRHFSNGPVYMAGWASRDFSVRLSEDKGLGDD